MFLNSQAAQEVFSSFCHRSESRTDLEKKDQDEMQMKLAKRPFYLMEVKAQTGLWMPHWLNHPSKLALNI